LSVIPELQLRQIVRYCEQRVPEYARDQVQVSATVRGQRVTIVKLLGQSNGVMPFLRSRSSGG
jgi:hypothetical protein